MAHVRVLPDHVVNQISAGEVVDRPASVVRELVDNAIDAGATEIVVYLESGGRSLIRVYDNGCGMERDDALLAFERHATSKLASVTDLNQITSLGFRGEALPSIAAVSKVYLKTRPSGHPTATEIMIEGGVVKRVGACSAPEGTDIEIRGLFFNTPVRRKFLREPKSEELRVKQWIIQSSLARPDIRYRLFCNEREVLNLPRRETAQHRAHSVYRGTMAPVDFSKDEIQVSGLVAHPGSAQADAKSFVILINGRLISDRAVLRAVKEGFDATLKDKEFPVGYIAIEMPPGLVDVNVHPQKSEVRFRFPRDVFLVVKLSIQEAVRSFRFPVRPESIQGSPGAGLGQPTFRGSWSQFFRPVAAVSERFYGSAAVSMDPLPIGTSQQPILSVLEPSPYQQQRELFQFSELRYLGQILSCYLLCTWQDSLVVIDMHAAHERCNYNRIREALRQRNVSAQQLLLPVVVELEEERVAALMQQHSRINDFGFGIRQLNSATVEVFQLPAVVKDGDATSLLKELSSLAQDISLEGELEEILDKVAARLACHASIRSGDVLNQEQVDALFKDLDEAEMSAACPHGRPVVVSFRQDDIERWFGRDR